MSAVETIAVFGDSITYGAWDPQGGWVQRLRTMLEGDRQPPWKRPFVYNLGVSGETTPDLYKRFSAEYDARFDADDKTGIIIASGVNDALFLSDQQRQYTVLPEFKKAIQSLFALAKTKTPFILCVGLTRVIELHTKPIPWRTNKHYRNATVAQYDEALEKVARNSDVLYCSLQKLPWDATTLEEGLHPNAAGHENIATEVHRAMASWM